MATETTPTTESSATGTTDRAPISLPTYTLGQEGAPNHFTATTSREDSAVEARCLQVGDAAFIKRSDLKWTYAIVSERVESGDNAAKATVVLRFEVDTEKNRKSFPVAQWGKYIRVIKAEESEMARLREEEAAAATVVAAANDATADNAAAVKQAEDVEAAIAVEEVAETVEPATEEAAKEEASEDVSTPIPIKKVPSSEASIGGESAKSNKSGKSKTSKVSAGGTSWFSGLFGGSAAPSKKPLVEVSEVPAVPEEKIEEDGEAEGEPVSVVAPDAQAPVVEVTDEEKALVSTGPMKEDPTVMALASTSFPTPSRASSYEESLKDVPNLTPPAIPEAIPEAVPEEEPVAEPEVAPVVASEATPVEEPAPQAAESKEEPNDTKENSDPSEDAPPAVPEAAPGPVQEQPPAAAAVAAVVPSSSASVASKEKDKTSSSLRIPLVLKSTLSLTKKNSFVKKNSILKGIFNKKEKKESPVTIPEEEKKVTMQVPVMAAFPHKKARDGKEWFDPEAREVDYDRSPTDLFQALEARQFGYAEEMYKHVTLQFTGECRTWVVARGHKKSSSLRFRALPLHAALVFGAPDALILTILHQYPKATRGRDVKGRLPIHLAMEHNASEAIVSQILEAFPKGFFAKDKKDMSPLDYINGNQDRAHMKKYLPLLTAAKLEDERTKWEVEKNATLAQQLAQQKVALQEDPAYMEETVVRVTKGVEQTYATKMELLENNYQKEIEALKKKHDNETQALLEGFEVKLNFERKLTKLKKTQAPQVQKVLGM